MLNRRIFEFGLDIMDIGKEPMSIGKVKQLDGTTLKVSLSNNRATLDLSDCVIRLFFKRSDDYSAYQKSEITIDVANSSVSIDCIDEIFEMIGQVVFEIEIADMDGYIETSPEFIIEVIDKLGDDEDREIVRVEEVSLMEELKDYVVESTAKIEEFKGLITEIAGDEYSDLLAGLADTKQTVESLLPTVNDSIDALQEKIDYAENLQISIDLMEENIQQAEAQRVSNEGVRTQSELDRESKEALRIAAETNRVDSEGIRKLSESNREQKELERQSDEEARKEAESSRVQKDSDRDMTINNLNDKVDSLSDIVSTVPTDGNFKMDVVVKGNIYPTTDGIKPEHSGSSQKNSGNIILPYSRGVAGFTKSKIGVRAIGVVMQPNDYLGELVGVPTAQNSDSVFLGSEVSQTFLCSKDKYPIVLSPEGNLAPIATQEWVMNLIQGLGILGEMNDDTPVSTSSTPTELFVGDDWSEVSGTWNLSDEDGVAHLTGAEEGKYKPIFAAPGINEVTYRAENREVFAGLWETENYIYGLKVLDGKISLCYFNRNGERGGVNIFSIGENILDGDIVTMHYNYLTRAWELYRFSGTGEAVPFYQVSVYMMSTFPEFNGGKNVNPRVSFAAKNSERVEILECPNPIDIRNHNLMCV